MTSTVFARLLVVAGLAACVGILWETRAVPGSLTTLVGAPLALAPDVVSAHDGATEPLPVSGDPPSVRFWDAGPRTVTMSLKSGQTATYGVTVLDRGWLYGAIAALLLIVVMAPSALTPRPGASQGPWAHLVSERGGGMSLGRVQFLIWVLPPTILYGALSLVSHALAPIDTQLAILLGLSGATTTLGAASNPPAADVSPETPPRLADLVQDWDARPDLSRYQYLLLSGVASIVIVAAFLQNLQFPAIPTPLLYLVAASQGTYLATKAVKTSRQDAQTSDQGSQGLTAIISAAPSALRLGAAEISLVDAPPGEASPEGSMEVPDRPRAAASVPRPPASASKPVQASNGEDGHV
jgi:hypothetical protein